MDCSPFSPYSACSYVVQTLLLFGITFAASYYLFVNYAADRSPHVLVLSAVAGVYVAAGGIWANTNAAAVAGAYWYEWLIWGLIGVAIGIGYVTINYGARPGSARSGTQMLCWILLGGSIGVLLYLGRLKQIIPDLPADLVAVAAVGAFVGISELVSRYRDEPTRALLSIPAVVYVALNAVAAILALGLGSSLVSDAGEPGVLGVRWGLVVGCGLSAMAILRSALFVVRTNGKDLQVGLGSLVQTLLDAADRAVDRLRAEERAWTVAKLMERLMSREAAPPATGIKAHFAGAQPRQRLADEIVRLVVIDAVALLPNYCIALTQNLNPTDRQAFVDAAKALSDNTTMTDEVKLFTLGLLVMNAVGPRVLEAAVSSLANDMLERAEEQVKAETQAKKVQDSADQTEQHAQDTADAARKVAEAARTEDASQAVQDAMAQVVASADLAATSARNTRQAASGLVKAVEAIVAPPNPPALPTNSGPAPSGSQPGDGGSGGQTSEAGSNGSGTANAAGAATTEVPGSTGGTPPPNQ